ncbi:MAG: 23S rRNA (adenine(1618)-N(6))-methyltransferase RlmF [Bacteroidota bacterium]
MSAKKKTASKTKNSLHPANRHRGQYDFSALIKTHPPLAPFVVKNKFSNLSINYFDPMAVKNLNTALLKHHYDIDYWDIPKNYLCPPVPGRADYVHHIADLLKEFNFKRTPRGTKIKCLDIGIGANCIFPIIGIKEYGWSFIGSEADAVAIASANKIIRENKSLQEKIEIRQQKNTHNILTGILQKGEYIDVVICNPPFHASKDEAEAAARRKLKNLQGKTSKTVLNFGGQNNELWYPGGEQQFVTNMIQESRLFAKSCFWYSSLISKESNLKMIYAALKKANAVTIKTIAMGQGNKKSRIVAWTFLSPKLQKIWAESRWK